MQKASVMKGSGLKSLEDEKAAEVTHVFGKNLEERVVTNDDEESPSISSFNVVSRSKASEEDDIELIRKRKFDAITGEEDEETIFQGDFKLFVWDLATSNWIEKGRGQLKLNDSIEHEDKKSRIIMRVSGTLRIILNVAVNPSFFKVIANSKTNIRFTDSQTVWAASGSNANQLRDFIEERLKMTAEEESEIKKRSKSDTDDDAETSTTSKRTKPDEEEDAKPSPAKTNEIETNETNQSDTTSTPQEQQEDQQQQPPPPKTTTTCDDNSVETQEKESASANQDTKEEPSEPDSKPSSKEEEDKISIKPAEEGDQRTSGDETPTTVSNGEKS